MSHQTKSLKKDLRTAVINKTLSHSEDDLQQRSQKLQRRLSTFMKNQSGYWGAFRPLHSEPQINFEDVNSNIRCCYPKVAASELEFYTDVAQWEKSGLHVQEPVSGKKINLTDLAGIFVPALAFHADGHRLGRGKGYYDRVLAEFTGVKVGICYQFNILNEVPTESHDVGMNYIITDEEIFQPNVGDQKSWN